MERRTFLKLGGTGVTAGMTGLAGCSAVGLGGGGGNVDSATKWLPEPGAFSADLDHYSFDAYSPKRIANAADDLLWDANVAPSTAFGSPKAKQIDWVVNGLGSVGSQDFTAYVGSFDSEWAATVLESQGYTRDSTYEDYSLYAQENANTGYAIGKNAVVRTARAPFGDSGPLSVAKKVVDANVGTADRYDQGNEDMKELANALPGSHRFSAQTFDRREETLAEAGQFENNVAYGESYRIKGTDTTTTKVYVFLNEGDVIDRDLETYVDDSGAFTNYRSRPKVKTNGRVAKITGTVPTGMTSLF